MPASISLLQIFVCRSTSLQLEPEDHSCTPRSIHYRELQKRVCRTYIAQHQTAKTLPGSYPFICKHWPTANTNICCHFLYCSWNQETTAARQEVARTRRALKDIQTNIAHVQAAAAADASALEAALAAAQLDAELEQQLERLAAALLQQQAALQRQVAEAQQQEQDLQVKGLDSPVCTLHALLE